MMTYRAEEVFTPGSFPRHTYVERSDQAAETKLRDALSVPGQIVSISGPSKSGKTVLVERVTGSDNLISIAGSLLRRPEDLWDRALDWMRPPSTPKTRQRAGMPQVVKEIGGSDFVLLLDDFQNVPKGVQEGIAREIKEAAMQGIKVCVASVPHKAEAVLRANPDLRGRVFGLDLNYWGPDELVLIAQQGFRVLNVELPDRVIMSLAQDSSGSPHQMQVICLNICFVHEARERFRARLRADSGERDLPSDSCNRHLR